MRSLFFARFFDRSDQLIVATGTYLCRFFQLNQYSLVHYCIGSSLLRGIEEKPCCAVDHSIMGGAPDVVESVSPYS